MEPTIEVIKQDISAAIAAFEENNFRFVNIMGNRVMSNLLIGGRNDLMIFGYLLKEVSQEFESIRIRYEKRLGDCKEIGEKFLKDLHSMVDDEKIGAKEVWKQYYDYEKEIIKYIPSEVELLVYKNNIDFTNQATSMLIHHLKENKQLLLEENNRLIGGILNELSRIINVHGSELHVLVFYLLMNVLDDYYKYLLYSKMKDGVIENKDEFKNKIYPYIDKIINLFSDPNSEDFYEHSNKILGELGSEFRIYFINYMEPEREVFVERRRPPVEIPKEAKEKIGEMIAEALEKEVKGR